MNRFKIGILGASGFVGIALTKKIIEESSQFKLYLFSRSYYKEKRVTPQFTEHQFDLKDVNKKIPQELFEVEILYYLISDSIPASSWVNPTKEISDNLIPFINLIEKLKDGNLKKIIFTSSAGTIYGPKQIKINEEGDKKPFSPHGITKLTTEYFLEYFRLKYGINYSIFRISNIYGPGQNVSKGLGVINTLLEKYLKGQELVIFGDGSSIRNYIFIEDVIEILTKSGFNNINTSEIINLASSVEYSLCQIIEYIETVVDDKLKLKFLKNRSSDNPCIKLDNSVLISKFKDFKETPLLDGLIKTFKSLQDEKRKAV